MWSWFKSWFRPRKKTAGTYSKPTIVPNELPLASESSATSDTASGSEAAHRDHGVGAQPAPHSEEESAAKRSAEQADQLEPKSAEQVQIAIAEAALGVDHSATLSTRTSLRDERSDEPPSAADDDGDVADEPTLPSQKDPTAARLIGKVKFFFEDERWGIIEFTDVDTKTLLEARVRGDQIEGSGSLYANEPVQFSISQGSGGRKHARQVTRLETRKRGFVREWRKDKRFGFIRTEANEPDVFVHYTGIAMEGPRELIEGEEVEFAAVKTDKGWQAVRVRPLESRHPLERFADIDRFRNGPLLESLKLMADEEDWNYKKTKSRRKYPVLYGYILYTFARLLEEGKIAQAVDAGGRRVASGNTGLVTPKQEEIFAYFVESRNATDPRKWVLQDFLEASHRALVHFPKQAEIANYFENPSDLIYDPDRELRVAMDHALDDNLQRFPEALRSNSFQLQNALEGARRNAIKRVRRNYKTAIPQYYQGQLQLLLPLCLTDPSKADLALVVSRAGEVYLGTTVLPLEVAYNNARLIARPDREWLEP